MGRAPPFTEEVITNCFDRLVIEWPGRRFWPFKDDANIKSGSNIPIRPATQILLDEGIFTVFWRCS